MGNSMFNLMHPLAANKSLIRGHQCLALIAMLYLVILFISPPIIFKYLMISLGSLTDEMEATKP